MELSSLTVAEYPTTCGVKVATWIVPVAWSLTVPLLTL